MTFSKFIFFIIFFLFQINSSLGEVLPNNHYKTKVASKVYEDLAFAVFNHRKADLPSFEIVQKEEFIAKYYSRSNRIVLEEKAYNLCRRMGRDSLNALSFILGHEFTHYLRNHPSGNFSCIRIDKNEKLKTRLGHEQEADLFGLFTAYLAEYNAMEVAPKILDILYREYGFPEKLSNYDPLKVRKRANKAAIKEIKKLIHTFETANYLTAIGDYPKAMVCYQTILKSYKNYEIYNNLGVVIALDAIDLSYNKNVPFIYPLELDLTSRLYKGREPYGAGFEEQKNVMLKKAKDYLTKALEYNPRSASAYINLSCINDLLKNYAVANDNLNQAKRYKSSRAQEGHIGIMEGILHAHQGNTKLAKKSFDLVASWFKDYNKAIAEYNIKALDGNVAQPKKHAQKVTEKLGGKSVIALRNYQNKKSLESNYVLRYDNIRGDFFSVIDRAGSNKTYLNRTSERVNKTSTRIGVGTEERIVREKYTNEVVKNIATNKGSFIVVPAKGLIFFMGSNGKVKEWGIFQM